MVTETCSNGMTHSEVRLVVMDMDDSWRLTITGTCSNGMTCSVVRFVVMEMELPPGGENWMENDPSIITPFVMAEKLKN